jgi:phage gp36-like protein
MAYSTAASVRKAIVPGSDGTVPNPLSHTAADLSDAELADAIAEADSQIDGALGGIYATPVDISSSVPHPIDFWSRNIAAYVASLAYRGSQDFADTDPIYRRFKMTQDAMNLVATGKASLALPRNTGGTSQVGVEPAYNQYVGDLWTPDDFSLGPATAPGLAGNRGWFDPWFADRNR